MPKCRVCQGELIKKRTKSGEIVLQCEDCKKIYRLKAKAEETSKKVEEEKEEEEDEVAKVFEQPKVEEPKMEEKEIEQPKVEKDEDDDIEEKQEEMKVETPSVVPNPAPIAVPQPQVVDNSETLEEISKSLAEISESLKALISVFNIKK